MSQPAYFLSMTLEQVRCFGPAQTLDLRGSDGQQAQWTIILGENGVGKTTLLQCLCAIRPTVFPRRPGFLVGTVPNVAHWSSFEATMRRHLAEEDVVLAAECLVVDPAGAYTLPLQHYSSIRRTRGNQYGDVDVNMFCCAYGATRRSGRAALGGVGVSDTTASLFSDDAALVDVEEWFLQADYARRTVSTAESRFQKIKQTLLQLLREVDDLRVVGLDMAPPQPAVEVHTPYGWVRPHQLSLGHRTLSTWVIDLASQLFARYPNSENPLAEPVVVLVDEIDLHLHPRWQRSVMTYLGGHFPGAQFIVTAHSPLVVQAVPDANLVVLTREPGADHVVIHNDPETVRGWRVDQILTSDLFGLESARPQAQAGVLERRRQLLRNDYRSEAEEAELTRLDQELEHMPQGETAQDVEAWELIHRFAEQLRAGKVAEQ
jgi:hypothetical protein